MNHVALQEYTDPDSLSVDESPEGSSFRKQMSVWIRAVLVLLAGLLSIIQSQQLLAMEQPLTVGIFPRRNAEITIELFTPLANYLEARLDRKVKLVTAKDFPSFWRRLNNGEFDLVHFNQYHYLKTADRYEVVAHNKEFGNSTIKGGIYVRRDSNITTIEQLRGKRIVFGGGSDAMMSYIVPHYLLGKSGLKKDEFESRIARNPPNSILAVYYRQVEAAGAGSAAFNLPSVRKAIPGNDLIALAESEALTHLPWAVNRSLSHSLRHRIRYLLVSMHNTPEGRAALATARLSGLLPANDHDYDNCRLILQDMSLLE